MSRWPVVRLGELCEFLGGGTPSRKNEAYFSGQIPWVTVKDFKAHEIFDTEDHITDEAIKASSTRMLPADTVLLVTRVGVGKVTLAKVPVTINQDIKAVIPKTEALDKNFLLRVLLSKSSELERVAVGATVKGVTLDQVRSLPIPLPSLPEQRRIVDLLNHAAGIRRLRRQALETTRALVPALFVEMFGEPGRNGKGWTYKTVAELCELVRGSSPRPQGDSRFFGGPVPRLMIADITRDGKFVTPKIDSLTLEGAKKSRPMLAGDVVMAVSGACGLPAILAVNACIHDGFVGFRALRNDLITTDYFYNFLLTQKNRAEHESVGAIFLNLTTDQIKQWSVPIPPIEMQKSFSVLCEQVSSIQIQQERHLAQADALLQSLMARYFGGAGETVGAQHAVPVLAQPAKPIRAQHAAPLRNPIGNGSVGADGVRPGRMPCAPTQAIPIAAEPPPVYTPGGQAALPAANQPVPGGIPARLLAAMQPGRAYSRAELIKATGISETDWIWAIRQLKEEGLVVQEGEKRGAQYRRSR